jgi:hypothetical protein
LLGPQRTACIDDDRVRRGAPLAAPGQVGCSCLPVRTGQVLVRKLPRENPAASAGYARLAKKPDRYWFAPPADKSPDFSRGKGLCQEV